METAFHVAGDPDILLTMLCPIDERGYIRFGFSGHSRTPSNHNQLLEGSVEIIDYLMEGFVPYLLSAKQTGEGLRLVVRKTGTNRDESVDWFVEKYLTSKGLKVTKNLA
jgi:hypothetical protein